MLTESVASQTLKSETVSIGTDNCATDLDNFVEKNDKITKPIICSRCKQTVSTPTTDKNIEDKSLQELFKVSFFYEMHYL